MGGGLCRSEAGGRREDLLRRAQDPLGGGQFGPEAPVTREQLAVMLWQYTGRPAPPNLLLPFGDADQASPWAADALRRAVNRGILSGKGGGVLDPTGTATRAEAAQMPKVFLEWRH